MRALINSGSKINAMIPAYSSKLGVRIRWTNVGAQKINDSTFKTFRMVLASFQVETKLEKARFFQQTFLLANSNIKMVLGMPLLTLSNANILFLEQEFTWRSYITTKALLTTKKVELINKKEFSKVALDRNFETFVVYVATLKAPLARILIDLNKAA